MHPQTNQERRDVFANSTRHHTPSDEAVRDIAWLRTQATRYGNWIISYTKPSREASLALTHLEDSLMWAIKARILQDADAS